MTSAIRRFLEHVGVLRGPTPESHFENEANWTRVSSSNVDSIAFYADVREGGRPELRVRFLNGSEYRYWGISFGQWLDFLASGSKGRWVWRVLRRGKVPYQRVY